MADAPQTPNNYSGVIDGNWGTRFPGIIVDGKWQPNNADGTPGWTDSITRMPIGTVGRFALPPRTPAHLGTWTPPQGAQDSMTEQITNPVSGYAQGPAAERGYSAQLGRFQFSNTAPVPATAPVGWGRYPGSPGGAPTAPWVPKAYIPQLPQQGVQPPPTPTFGGTTTPPPAATKPPPTVDGTPGGAPISEGTPFPGWGANWQTPANLGANPTPLTSGMNVNTLSNTQLGQMGTPEAYAILRQRLGSDTLANQFVNATGGASGGSAFDPAAGMNAGRATGAIQPPQWAWDTYAKQGLGSVVGGKWVWSDAMLNKRD